MLAFSKIAKRLDGTLAGEIHGQTEVPGTRRLPCHRKCVCLVFGVRHGALERDQLVAVVHPVRRGRRDLRHRRVRRLHVHRHPRAPRASLRIPNLQHHLAPRRKERVLARHQTLRVRRRVNAHRCTVHQPRHRKIPDGVVRVPHRPPERLGVPLPDRVPVRVARQLRRRVRVELRHARIRAGKSAKSREDRRKATHLDTPGFRSRSLRSPRIPVNSSAVHGWHATTRRFDTDGASGAGRVDPTRLFYRDSHTNDCRFEHGWSFQVPDSEKGGAYRCAQSPIPPSLFGSPAPQAV